MMGNVMAMQNISIDDIKRMQDEIRQIKKLKDNELTIIKDAKESEADNGKKFQELEDKEAKTGSLYDQKIKELEKNLKKAQVKLWDQQCDIDWELDEMKKQYNANLDSAAHQGRVQAIKKADREMKKMREEEKKRREDFRRKMDELNSKNAQQLKDVNEQAMKDLGGNELAKVKGK